MSLPFLKQVALHIFEHHKDNTENLCVVLPGKRGALFLKKYLAQVFKETIWLPTIISAEDLVREISGLQTADEVDQLCMLYDSYQTLHKTAAEPFESFAKWGGLILQDFNEIDRHLANPKQVYENLAEIKEIENWSLNNEELTEFQKKYLAFMHSLSFIYSDFTTKLLAEKLAYQGLAYRVATEKLSTSQFDSIFSKYLFCGFNALNTSELKIISHLVKKQKAELLWDGDPYYLKNVDHEAGHFLRKNLELFPQKNPSFIKEHFLESKKINILSVPKQMGQAMAVKQILEEYIQQKTPLDSIAIVLANEKLLWPVLRQLPNEVEHVNITMEYPLRYTATSALLESCIQLQVSFDKQENKNKYIYYTEFISIIKQPLFQNWLQFNNINISISAITEAIHKKNIAFIHKKHLIEFFGESYAIIQALFTEANNNLAFNDALQQLINDLINHFNKSEQKNEIKLEKEYLSLYKRSFNRIGDALSKYPYFKNIHAFKQLFSQITGSLSAPFIGEPLKGLQIMGLLETRTLDFEHVIFVNVNESVLPSGKSVNSFIPNDLKRAFNLPLYTEKDAIYSYHFYRLLQRAKEVSITYDCETDTFGKGEKSRFVSQLQIELPNYSANIEINEYNAESELKMREANNQIAYPKNQISLQPILHKATTNSDYTGLSPSSINTYKECALKFYFRYGALLKETENVEESAESNTFGSILHLCLEKYYTPFIGKHLQSQSLHTHENRIEKMVQEAFLSFFDLDEIKGKNLIQAAVIKAYLEKQIKTDLSLSTTCEKNGVSFVIKDLEKEFNASLMVNIEGGEKEVFIRGKIDRIDSVNTQVRIIDYKNSVKQSDKFVFTGFEDLFDKIEYNKQLQLFMYAWLLYKNSYASAGSLQPGIIAFKDYTLQPHLIRTKEKEELIFSEKLILEFEFALSKFISELLETNGDFKQTLNSDTCIYCGYNQICLKEVKSAF
ncbi:MAG: PD-(D/E)XK nuclease family protein [Sphingobacteriaceae bacterium]|nr:PD-(D/E)XK nuclease family protein [Sphingobacteriaceae bacterium]